MIAEKPKHFYSFLSLDTTPAESQYPKGTAESASLELAVINRMHRLQHICWCCNQEDLIEFRL